MSFDEAVALLGLSVPFTAKDVRRAYLRLLKVHKPESDPDGFMRLRQAYEMFEGVERVTRRDDGPDAPASEPAPQASERAAPSEPAAVEASGDDAPAPLADESALLPWQRPVPEDPKIAAAVLTDWLARAKSDASAPPPPMKAALRLLWSMLERRAFKTSGALYTAMDEWLAQIGGARGQLAWGMTQGLWQMRKRIPEELYAPMVRAVAERKLAGVKAAVQALELRRPGSARELLQAMRSEAPELEAVFGRALTIADRAGERMAARAAQRARPAGRPWGLIGGVVLAALVLARLVSVGIGASADAPKASEADATAAVAAMRDMARRLGSKPMVDASDAIDAALQRADCAAAHREVADAFALMKTSPLQNDLIPHLVKVKARVSARCPEAVAPAPRDASLASSATVDADGVPPAR